MNGKTDLQVQSSADKNNLQITEKSTEIIFIINSNSCNSKIIDIEKHPLAQLLAKPKASSPFAISGYRSINRQINFS